MLALTANRLSAIRRESRALVAFFVFMSVLVVWAAFDQIAHPFPAGTRTLAGIVFQGAAITGKVQILWIVKVALGALVNLTILYHFIRLMGSLSKGQLFTAQNVAHVHQIGVTFSCAVAVWLLVLICAAPEISAEQDQWLKVMQSFPGGVLMSGIVFLFASRLMNEGRELRDEQDLVV